MTSPEKVFEIAQSGDGYLAVEKSLFVVRKLKRQKKTNDAAIFLIKLACILLDNGQNIPSAISANRAVELILQSKSEFESTEDIKNLLFSYIEKITPSHASIHLFSFFDNAIELFGQDDPSIIRKKASIADKSDNYYDAQQTYIEIIAQEIEKDGDPTETLNLLYKILFRWTESIQDEKSRLFTAQFIICRCVISISSQNEKCLSTAINFFNRITSEHSNNPEISQPLFTFTKYFLKGLQQNSPSSINFLTQQYYPLLAVSRNLQKIISTNKEVYFHTGNSLSNFLNSFTQMSDNGNQNGSNNNGGGLGGIGQLIRSLFGGGGSEGGLEQAAAATAPSAPSDPGLE
ncbi:hypothetical protein TRFO_26188 [Tritrichomonas foetus]|uniref:Uncharacterized protein n=1 Tax=Tritrichomonas foetus TaxID=1144522 RepID=A0A1J4K3G0_9EUKA|nr:hypothetical protein TRFO_26188 [Tritrichomonas foetus]|eukprot:OHT05911.1 hypothetical protein TRFO_26188 [Tritrichomonas foetus]